MDKELLRVIIEELFTAALEFADGKKFLTLALKLTKSILLKDAVLDRIVAGLFGAGVDVMSFAKSVAAAGTPLNVVASNGPDLTADEIEASLRAGA